MSETFLYANIIIDIAHEKVDRPFQYKIPPVLREKVAEGKKVYVPFGAGNKIRSGYVVSLTNDNEYAVDKLKEIQSVDENAIGAEEKLMLTAAYMRHRYGGTMIQSLQTVLPIKQKVRQLEKKAIRLIGDEDRVREYIARIQAPRFANRRKILIELLEIDELPVEIATEKLGISKGVLKTLEKDGMIEIRSMRAFRGFSIKTSTAPLKNPLSPQQQAVADELIKKLEEDAPKPSLLHGITGSGKTEVYMEVIAAAVASGKQAIVLIPEIALTFQTLKRFYARFGKRVAIMHSRLSAGERFDQYTLAKEGKVDVMIGPRSALFTPFANLGMIVIDEEHEGSYKSESMPRYHAVEMAEYIAKREGALLLLGSATPSITSYYKAQKGNYDLHKLNNRFGEATLPTAQIIDMRQELKEGNKSVFSRKLKALLTERVLTKRQQAMLFINRRGYAGFVSCRDCGEAVKCPHCEVSLSQHGSGQTGTLVCHYCGYEEEFPRRCPKCSSEKMYGMRAGTEQIAEQLCKLYPSMRVLRMDADTTKKKDDYEEILGSFAAHEADTLVGTQMIVKGHDFPGVTVAGAVMADLSLFSADYRAAERTFNLITQAAGRAGRGEEKGEVVIQTYQPEHYALTFAAKQDYEGFYEEEISYRTLGAYPPVMHLLSLQLFGKNEDEVVAVATALKDELEKSILRPGLYLMGPTPANIKKINDVYRYGIYVKYADLDELICVKDFAEQYFEKKEISSIRLQFDFDPMNGF
ncbi:MAG: primosomal protein N' [Lachnospiraceae bacterium]|nr:primosomal protein N' [Lachnospiraceae bacterium]